MCSKYTVRLPPSHTEYYDYAILSKKFTKKYTEYMFKKKVIRIIENKGAVF